MTQSDINVGKWQQGASGEPRAVTLIKCLPLPPHPAPVSIHAGAAPPRAGAFQSREIPKPAPLSCRPVPKGTAARRRPAAMQRKAACRVGCKRAKRCRFDFAFLISNFHGEARSSLRAPRSSRCAHDVLRYQEQVPQPCPSPAPQGQHHPDTSICFVLPSPASACTSQELWQTSRSKRQGLTF